MTIRRGSGQTREGRVCTVWAHARKIPLLTAPYRHRLRRVTRLRGGVHEQVVNGGGIGAAGSFQRDGAKSFNNAPCNAGDQWRPATAGVDFRWSTTAGIDLDSRWTLVAVKLTTAVPR